MSWWVGMLLGVGLGGSAVGIAMAYILKQAFRAFGDRPDL